MEDNKNKLADSMLDDVTGGTESEDNISIEELCKTQAEKAQNHAYETSRKPKIPGDRYVYMK